MALNLRCSTNQYAAAASRRMSQPVIVSHRRSRRSGGCAATCALSAYHGKAVAGGASNGSILRVRMAQWLESKASIDVPLPLEPCWNLWEDRENIPNWMEWIKSVKVLESDTRLSKWTLSTNQFGRDWEFSWLARNLAPIKGQKIHWVSEPGSTSVRGLELKNKGQVRFIRKGAQLTNVTISFSYEVPGVLVPFLNALNPLVESIVMRDMQRFKEYAVRVNGEKQPTSAPATAKLQQ